MSGIAVPVLSLTMAVLSAGYAWISQTETQLLYSAGLTLLFCMLTTSAIVLYMQVTSVRPSPAPTEVKKACSENFYSYEFQVPRASESREKELLPLNEIGKLELFEKDTATRTSDKRANHAGDILNEVTAFLESR